MSGDRPRFAGSLSAEDVAYTFTALKELGPKVRWGADVQQFVDSATATSSSPQIRDT